MWYFETINYRLHLYYANSLRNLIMKICAHLPQIPSFGFDARSVSIILEHSSFYPSIFTPIYTLFKVLRKFLRKKRFFQYTLAFITIVAAFCFRERACIILANDKQQ